MTLRRSTRISPISAAATALLSLLFAGCQPKPAEDTANQGTASAAAVGSDTAVASFEGFPGDTAKAGALRTAISLADFDFKYPRDINRVAVDTFQCPADDCGGLEYVTFLIIPEKNARNVDWEDIITHADKKGAFVAQYQLLDSVTVKWLGLGPKGRLFLFVGDVGAGQRGTAFVNPANVITGGQSIHYPFSEYRICDDNTPDKRESSAKSHVKHDNCRAGDVFGAASGTRGDLVIPASPWISCANGCCQSSQTRFTSARSARVSPATAKKRD